MRLCRGSGRRQQPRVVSARGSLTTLAIIVVTVALVPVAAFAQEVNERLPAFTFRTSIKAGALLSNPGDGAGGAPRTAGVESLWRVRFEPQVTVSPRARFTLAYEQRFRYTSSLSGVTAGGILPIEAVTAYRLRPLDWGLSQSSHASWRHEIDRANAELQFRRANITIGRQAVGWGRGVMFGAVDLFAPFSPLEADREWRPGVDAARADVKLTDRSSLDLVGAFGTTLDRSVVAARARGYAGRADVEVMGGRRAQDLFGGMTTSAAVGDAEFHGEIAVFHLPEPLPGGSGVVVWKGVAGGSYRFPLGSGLLAYIEYHYSGFGAPRPESIVTFLLDPGYAERYLRGDTQILSRHAAAVLTSYEVSPEIAVAGQWLHNPADASGVIAPNLTLTLSDRLSVFGAIYVSYGAAPIGLIRRSEYGAVPLSGFFQLRIYL